MTFNEQAVDRDTVGRFSEKRGGVPEVALSKTPFETRFAGDVRPGDTIHMEGNTTGGPFSFAVFNNRAFRTALKSAGRPSELTVLSSGRAAEDGHTDNDITFDIGGEPFTLSFHRERQMLVSRPETAPDEACGDYPAPCNCDDPKTHNGR